MTFIIIFLTSAISLFALANMQLSDKLRFNAYLAKHSNQWYRFFTYAFVHADWMHLMVNMFVLYSFGRIVEMFYKLNFGVKGILYFIMLYIGGIMFSVLASFGKHKDDFGYNAVGASGAVSAVVFASIIFYPTGKIFLFFIPIGIPAFIFGIIYLVYSAYMANRNVGNIGHDAHFWGAIFGAMFTVTLKPTLFMSCIEQIKDLFS